MKKKLNEEAAELRRFAELVAHGSHKWVDFEEFAFTKLQQAYDSAIDDLKEKVELQLSYRPKKV